MKKTPNTLDNWENPAWRPSKPDWEFLKSQRVKQPRANRRTQRQSFINQMRDSAKVQLANERQRLGIKTTSHQPATIAQLLGNPIGA
jgi:hypothetical protein